MDNLLYIFLLVFSCVIFLCKLSLGITIKLMAHLKSRCLDDEVTQHGENVHFMNFLKSVLVQLGKNSQERSDYPMVLKM